MHRKLALGAFAVCLSAGLAQAQTSTTDPAAVDPAAPAAPVDLVVPEGFALQSTPLTAEELLGATIYDIAGDSIGEVHDLIFAAPDAGAAGTMPEATDGSTAPDATATAPATDTGTADTDTATDPAAAPDSGTAADSTAPDATAAPETGTAADGTTPDATAPDATTTPDTGTATDDTATTTPDTGTAADDTATTAPDTGTAADSTAPDMGATAADGTAAQSGQITHAVLDIGGFLGMGQHRIALPVSDLRIYRSDSDIRVYLPWTREQMTALPEYDENDPATLGSPLMTP